MPTPPEAVSRGPPEPYIIDGQRFFNLHQAAQIIQTITDGTLRNWARHGSTPFGFELAVQREPVTHHRRSTQTPRTFLASRMLIPEARVFALKEILEIMRGEPKRPGPFSRDNMDALEASARRFRSPVSHSQTPPAP